MKIKIERLKTRMYLIKSVLFTQIKHNKNLSSEVWIKFKDGKYVYINLEQHITSALDLVNLVGKGDALNITDEKRNELTQIGPRKRDIIKELIKAKDGKKNIEDTIDLIIDLFEDVPEIIF
jgi:hypothetical protein